MIKDVIFDFDGTLSDTYPVFTKAFSKMLANHGINDTYESIYSKLKVSVGHAISCYDIGISPDEASREMSQIYNTFALSEQRPVKGAGEILKYIKDNGGRNYIFTHSGIIVRELIEKWGISEYFTDIIDESLKIRRKPAPDGVLILMRNNGIKPEEALIVGDRDIDVISGKEAGILGCMFDAEGYYKDYKSDFRIENLCELKKIVC